MGKTLVIDPSHHAVQMAQKVEFICVVCQKCSCCSPDRLKQECRTLAWYRDNHITPPGVTGPLDNL